MIRILTILLMLAFFGHVRAEAPTANKIDLPQNIMGKIGGKHLWLHFLPEGAMPKFKKHKDTRLINVEPGCLVLEAYCDLIDDKRLKIRMPRDGYFTKQSMSRMGVSVKDVIVEFQPSESTNLAGTIVSISPFNKKQSEQDAAMKNQRKSE